MCRQHLRPQVGSWEWGRGWSTQEAEQMESDSRFFLLLLPATSLLEGQVNDSATGHVIVSQRVGILDEDALIL